MSFYGYKHWTLESTPRVFYVGRGLKGRSSDASSRNHKWRAIVARFGLRVEVCVGPLMTLDEINAWEIEHIAKEGTFTTNHSHDDVNDIGCNFTKGGGGTVGWKPSKERCQQQSEMMKGKPKSEEHRQKLRDANKGKRSPLRGRKQSLEQRQRTSEALRGHVISEETKEKIRQTLRRHRETKRSL